MLSGPAGGVVGCALTAYSQKRRKAVIGFDMVRASRISSWSLIRGDAQGGTSTDVSRYAGAYDLVYEAMTAGIRVACPQLALETVAACAMGPPLG